MKRIVVLPILVLLFFTNQVSALTTEHLHTKAVQYAGIPVTTGSQTEWRSIYFIAVPNPQEGEILVITANGQVSNELQSAAAPTTPDGFHHIYVELAKTIEVRTTVSNGQEDIGSATVSIMPVTINGRNFDRKTHYNDWDRTTMFTVPANPPTVLYVVARLRARSTAAQPGHQINVQLGQGEMNILRIKPN